MHVIQSSNLSKTIQHYDIIKTCTLYYLFHLNFIKHYSIHVHDTITQQ
jgi:hypothetical protein